MRQRIESAVSECKRIVICGMDSAVCKTIEGE